MIRIEVNLVCDYYEVLEEPTMPYRLPRQPWPGETNPGNRTGAPRNTLP